MSRAPRRRAAVVAVRRLWDPENEPDDGGVSSDDDNDIEVPIDIETVHASQSAVDADESTSESSSDDDEANHNIPDIRNPLQDKNNYIWSKDIPRQGRRGAANIIHSAGGPKPESRRDTVRQTWELFFTNEILTEILRCSQLKLDSLQLENSPILTLASLKCYFGILYFRGANEDTKIPIHELWSEEYSTFYRAAMSRSMFQLWNRILRFDEPEGRADLLQTDTFAAFRNIFELLNARLPLFLTPSHSITVDEQLVASKNRSPHRIYCPQKPGKYGELIRWVCDSYYNYFLSGFPLTKRPQDEQAAADHKEKNKAHSIVMNLAEPFLDSGRNITADRFFGSQALAEDLLARRTTYVGTLASNKRFIPDELRTETQLYESKFVFGGQNKQITLQSYQVKKKKKVYMLSTMHHDKAINLDVKSKSDIQLFYNSTKAGVDTADKMCKQYTVRSMTRRWPMVHMQNMIDVCGVNAYTLWSMNEGQEEYETRHNRRKFLLTLAHELAIDNVIIRLQKPSGLHSSVILLLEKFSGQKRVVAAVASRPGGRSNCVRCLESGKSTKDCNKSSKMCYECQQFVCGKHSESQVICNVHM